MVFKAAAAEVPKRACVVLLHGLARTSRSMARLKAACESAGLRALSLDYPSRKATVEDLAMQVIAPALRQCDAFSCGAIHFVTHSMGGLVLRCYLARRKVEGLGRVVMLSPPNQGSEVVDRLRGQRLFRWYGGPAGAQLGTGPEGIAARLGAVDYPLGIITGDRPAFFDRWLTRLLPGPADGKVAVERARVAGMTDFLVMPCSHAFIMRDRKVIQQSLHFIRQGSFQR